MMLLCFVFFGISSCSKPAGCPAAQQNGRRLGVHNRKPGRELSSIAVLSSHSVKNAICTCVSPRSQAWPEAPTRLDVIADVDYAECMEIVDSYLHCGLTKYRPIEDVETTISAAGVSRAVIVQHLGEYDNSYIRRIVEKQPSRFAGVCLVDHRDTRVGHSLEALLVDGPFRGVRLTADVLRETPAVFTATADAGGVIAYFAPQGIAGSVDTLIRFLDTRPDCRLVITHLGNPSIEESPGFAEHRAIFRLASYAGVYLQISGMGMFGQYPHEPLYPLIDEAARAFGTERLVWGSNFPVVGEIEEYKKELRLLLDGRLPVPAESIPAIAGGNSRALWFRD